MDFQLLGPVRVCTSGKIVNLGVRKQRFVLSVLALEANRLVPLDRLIDLVWPDMPPATARGTIQAHISCLRAMLSKAGAARAGVSLRREGSGYLLACDPDDIDVHRFMVLVDRAAAEPDPARRLSLFDEALRLWRGPALAGTTSEDVRGQLCRHLDEARLIATEHRLGSLVELARYDQALSELTRLVGEYPERHRFTELLMTTLNRVGRSGEALAAYREAKHRMAEDFGLDPPARLQQLELAILRGDTPHTGQPARTAAVPAQLPADVPVFVGRVDTMARLDAQVAGPARPAAVVILAVSGTAGVGKTCLAVHWAHRVADRFPDGQLYVNLRGFDPTGDAVDPAAAVRRFLDAFEVPVQCIPADPEAQAALYRSLVNGKRILIVLDNARDTGQVLPLLPGSADAVVLVTSRSELVGLVASHGAHPVPLDLLTPREAGELLTRRLGAGRTEGEAEAVCEILTRCARLPLALVVVAAHAAMKPRMRLAALAADLRDAQYRWQALSTDVAATDVRAVFSWSYHLLSPEAARLFRLLGLHPGPEVTVPAAASLAGCPPARARELLAELGRANLIADPVPGRHAFHDLLHEYAAERAAQHGAGGEREAALNRLFGHYLHAAWVADRHLNPHGDYRNPIGPAPADLPAGTENIADAELAKAWFTAEHRVLLAVIRCAVTEGFDTAAWQLAAVFAIFLDRGGLWNDLIATQEVALRAARRLGDRSGEALAYHLLGRAHRNLGRPELAGTLLGRALESYREAGDDLSAARVCIDLSLLLLQRGRLQDALEHAERARRLYEASDHDAGLAGALSQIGYCHGSLGDHRQSLVVSRRALRVLRRIGGDPRGESWAWKNIGDAHLRLGDEKRAISSYRYALDRFRHLGDRYQEARALDALGDAHRQAGGKAAAREAYRHALAILAELDHRDAQAVRVKLDALRPGGSAASRREVLSTECSTA